MAEHTKESVEQSHITGIKGLLAISSYSEIFCSRANLIAFIASVLITLGGVLLEMNQYEIIIEVTNILISFLPGILGFTIAGFTLMVGFLQTDLIEGITERINDSVFTLYQKIVSKFALGVLIQSFALIIGYAYHFIVFYESKSLLILNLDLERSLNILAVFIIWYSLCLSVFIVCQVILNIFDFSQLHHFVVISKKMKSNKK